MNSILLIVFAIGVFAGFPWSILGLLVASYGAYRGPSFLYVLGLAIVVLSVIYNIYQHGVVKGGNKGKLIETSVGLEINESKNSVKSKKTSWLILGLYILVGLVAINLFFEFLSFIFKSF